MRGSMPQMLADAADVSQLQQLKKSEASQLQTAFLLNSSAGQLIIHGSLRALVMLNKPFKVNFWVK